MKSPRHSHWFLVSLALVLSIHAHGADVKKVDIIAYNTLSFNQSKIEVTPNQKVVVTFKDESTTLSHQWVLLNAGVDPGKFSRELMRAREGNGMGIPKALEKQIYAQSPMLPPGGSATVKFQAPAASGAYTYVCACGLHYEGGMSGKLIVK